MNREERMARAGDYVLGRMDAAERERAERDMEIDAEFRHCVALLAERMQAFHGRPAQSPAEDIAWEEVAARLAALPQMAGEDGIRPPPVPTHIRPRHADRSAIAPRPWQLGGWRGTALALALVLACGLGFLAGRAGPPAERPSAIAVLEDGNGTPAMILEASADGSATVRALGDIAVPPGKVLELWSRAGIDGVPVSLGAFGRHATIAEFDAGGGADRYYEVTLEEAPGAAIGRLPGPVLFSGAARALPDRAAAPSAR